MSVYLMPNSTDHSGHVCLSDAQQYRSLRACLSISCPTVQITQGMSVYLMPNSTDHSGHVCLSHAQQYRSLRACLSISCPTVQITQGMSVYLMPNSTDHSGHGYKVDAKVGSESLGLFVEFVFCVKAWKCHDFLRSNLSGLFCR